MAEHRSKVPGSWLVAYLRRMAASIAAMFLAGAANAAQDIAGNVVWYRDSIFPQAGESASAFWGHQGETWVNKWATNESGFPVVGTERFFLSSTALVWLTDLWHAAQTVMITSFQAAALLYRRPTQKWIYLVDLVVLKISFSAGWWLGKTLLSN